MRGPRLNRSKTSDPAVGTSARTHDPRPATVKTSFDDLRSPDGRQKLREQLSSQFPESYASSLKSSPSATDMAGGQWLGVGQNAAAKSSSSSIESAGNGKRLSTVPERNNNTAIDVEQAINLLTELKKTATPEQLVALHKALLPTRDSIISTADASTGQRASLIRQKSMLPAGLATRGGASEDLLKRQEDVEPTLKKKRSGKSEGHHRLQSKSSIAALDLADEAANPLPAQRAATPNDQHYFGAYRPGTLRITNGSASPEPGPRPRTSGEAAGIAVSSDQVIGGRHRAGSLAKAVSEDAPATEPTIEIPKQRKQSSVGEFKATIPAPKSRDPSQSRQYRPKRSQEQIQSGSTTPVARSREPSLSRQPLHVETKASKQSIAASKKASTDSFMRRSLDISRQSIDSIRHSIDDGRVSPIDAPRFVHRWSHRASQISQEYQNECDVPISPFDDKQQAASSFAQRLSTVYDGGDAENTANETPEDALNKLEGNTREREERNSLKGTAASLNAVRPKPVTYHSEPRPMPTKADSGYVSDASHRSVPWQAPHDYSAKQAESPATYEHSQPGYKEIIHKPEPEGDDIQSLYTLEQVLKMPNFLSTPSTPSRPEAARKHSSLLKLTGLKKSNAAASKTTLDPHSSADSLPLPHELGGSSPVEAKSPKPTKKLQKKMPEEVRKQRREQREKAKQSSLSLAGQDLDAMDMPNDVSELASSPAPGSALTTPSRMTLPPSPLAERKESTPAEALSELVGDSQQPAELDTDESASAPKRSLSRKQSRKSRRRSRQSTITAEDGEGRSEGKGKRAFSLGRKRSKSKRRSGSLTPKRNSQGVPEVPSIAALSATWDENGSQDSLPLYSDTGSVARTLGSNPYDISTGMFEKGGRNRGPALDQLQSPHQISTSFSRTKTGGLQGMDSAMASELARAKSRDVAMQKNENLYDRPRMATPNKRSQTDMPPRAKSMMPNAVMVEQRAPGWNAKPVFQKSSFESLDSGSRQRPHSVAESIPSLPELPVDTEERSAKAAEYLAKRNRQMQASPVLAESPTPSSSPDPSASEHPGFSNESVADAVAKAVEARRAKHAERVKHGQQGDRLRPAGPRMDSSESGSSGQVSLQLHGPGVDERPYSDASASVVVGVGSPREEKEEERPQTAPAPAPAQNESGEIGEMTVWVRQAQMWREKRESASKPPSRPVDEGKEVKRDDQSAPPPSVVVSRHSALDSLPSTQRRRKSASEHANAYRDLIGPDNSFDEPLPNPNRASTQTTSTVTTTTTTIGNRSSTDTVVVEDAQPAKAYQQAKLIHRDRSPGGRVRTPSGSYHPYRPDHAASAERSRASLIAQHQGKEGRTTQSLDIQRRVPRHQQQDTLESILGRYDRTLSPVPASDAGSVVDAPGTLNAAPRSGPGPAAKGPMVDRYGGGLQYGFERGVGVQGSSGLRGGRMDERAREGNRFSEQFGLDFGDVPVFLRRA